MKKILKMLRNLILIILGLLVCLVIFLFICYSVFDRNLNNAEKDLATKSKIVTVSHDSSSLAFQPGVLNLIPVPQKVNFTGGSFIFPEKLVCSQPDSLKTLVENILLSIPETGAITSGSGTNLSFSYNNTLHPQGYVLDIKPTKVNIEFSTRQGLYYAIVSLKILKQNYNGKIPCAHIEDSPDLAVRGVMLDISRNKVPTKKTLLGIAQLLADLKYNHLELYIEGFSFAYPSFRKFWEATETPVTGEEIKELDSFCKAHFIDLTANQNSLGHMMAWLATDDYKDLAECPKGYKMLGLISMKSTLDPSDRRSIELVTKMTDDLLPNFSSPNFNVNLDEPFELGKGKSKELCAKVGEGTVYLDYATKIHDLVTARNKKMMMWGDIILRHPELIARVPKDITLLDWGYESSYPYERHCKILQASGLNYMVCPGTNSWTSITGRTENMIGTIGNATSNAVKYGASGMLITDWGDMGHWQYLPVSYAGFTSGAALSWNSKTKNEMPLNMFLNTYIFRDKSLIMGDLVLDLGKYCDYEEIPLPNMTTTVLAFQFGLRDRVMENAIFNKVTSGITDLLKDLSPEMITVLKEKYDNRHPFDFHGLTAFLDSKDASLQNVRMDVPDSLIIKDEYMNAIRLIRLGAALQSYIQFRGSLSIEDQKSQLNSMKALGNKYLTENHRLWLLRNKSGGLETSTASLYSLLDQIDKRLTLLDKSPLSRGFNRFLEKLSSAAVVLYIKSTS